MTDKSAAVRVENAFKSFGDRVILDDFNFHIDKGEIVALLGASGSGKTTLLRILSGLDRVDRGIVRVPANRSVVFQEPRLVLAQRVWRNVVLGLPRRLGGRERAIAALSEVGLADHATAWPKTLSGGEAQRVALARSLVRNPRLLLLDEPFAALDALTRLRMQQLVRELISHHHPATLLVTHDVDEAILLADRVTVLREGRLAFDEAVTIPGDRSRIGSEFLSLRETLLSHLGISVASDAPRPGPSPASASNSNSNSTSPTAGVAS